MPPRRHLVMEAEAAVVEAHQSLRMVAAVVKEGAIYSAAAVVPRPRLPAEAAETEAHSRLPVAVAKLRHPRLPVTAVVAALVVATMVAVASVAF